MENILSSEEIGAIINKIAFADEGFLTPLLLAAQKNGLHAAAKRTSHAYRMGGGSITDSQRKEKQQKPSHHFNGETLGPAWPAEISMLSVAMLSSAASSGIRQRLKLPYAFRAPAKGNSAYASAANSASRC
jgi:hypothetical protein